MIDLHLHSFVSDGDLSPSEIVRKAKQNGISTLSLTDHDSISGIAEAQLACKQLGIRFIPFVIHFLVPSTVAISNRYSYTFPRFLTLTIVISPSL
jgi:predicted metal-dependent phosphoesterase TrpH